MSLTERPKRIYYGVLPESPVMRVIEWAVEQQETFRRACRKLGKEFGTKDVWVRDDSRLIGVVFPGETPKPWRRHKDGSSVPDKRTKEGRALQVRLDSLPRGVDAMRFCDRLGPAVKGDCILWPKSGGVLSFTVFEEWGGTYVLSVPCGLNLRLPGCFELKMSEYWKLREDASESSGLIQAGRREGGK